MPSLEILVVVKDDSRIPELNNTSVREVITWRNFVYLSCALHSQHREKEQQPFPCLSTGSSLGPNAYTYVAL